MTFKDQLAAVRSRYDEQDSYALLEELLAKSEPFVATYKPQRSRQSSQGMRQFGGNFTS